MMYCVYLIKSLKDSCQTYVGYTIDLTERLERHNAGRSKHTAAYKPWKLVSCIYFDDESKALSFEKYLKSGSGYAFAQRRLW